MPLPLSLKLTGTQGNMLIRTKKVCLRYNRIYDKSIILVNPKAFLYQAKSILNFRLALIVLRFADLHVATGSVVVAVWTVLNV